jgi:hypothetical protein
LVREQRWLSTSVQEQDTLILLEKAFADQINHPGCGAPGIDRVEQNTFARCEQTDGFPFLFG